MAKYDAKTKDNKCVFCEIVEGRMSASIFWEDNKHIAFLAIDPNTEGFSCVIPKAHFDSDPLHIPDETLGELIIASKKVAKSFREFLFRCWACGYYNRRFRNKSCSCKTNTYAWNRKYKEGRVAAIPFSKRYMV